MESQASSCMRYYDSIYEKYLSKIPKELTKVNPKLLVMRNEKRRACNQYDWQDEDLAKMRAMRLQGVSFSKMAEHFRASQTVLQRLALKHNMVSPNNRIKNRPPEATCPSTE